MHNQRWIVLRRATRERVDSGEAFAASVCVHAELAQQLRRSPSHYVELPHRLGPIAG